MITSNWNEMLMRGATFLSSSLLILFFVLHIYLYAVFEAFRFEGNFLLFFSGSDVEAVENEEICAQLNELLLYFFHSILINSHFFFAW